jgi:hypothetical protein
MRNNFLALGFPDVLMLDFDYDEDQNKSEAHEQTKQTLRHLSDLTGNPFVWALYETDRGMHAFLVSHRADFTDMRWIHLMLLAKADPWYAAFTTVFGWQIRLNAKEKSPDDFVSRPLAEEGKQSNFFFAGSEEKVELVDNYLWQKVQFHMSLITLAQELKFGPDGTVSKLKCDIGNVALEKNAPYVEEWRQKIQDKAREFGVLPSS